MGCIRNTEYRLILALFATNAALWITVFMVIVLT